MTKDEIKLEVLRILGAIAPEAELSSIRPDAPFRDQLDLDSMDFLNFVIALDQQLKVAIPELDYAKLNSLNACVDYLQSALRARPTHLE